MEITMLRYATAMGFCVLIFGSSIFPASALDKGASGAGIVKLAQASTVTKFRGLYFGMDMPAVNAALAGIGASSQPFKEFVSGKIDPAKFTLLKGGEDIGTVTFSESGKL